MNYSRIGEPWSAWEEEVLIRDFKSGSSLEEQCQKHQRAAGGINSRLEQALEGESHRRRGITQHERDELLCEIKKVRAQITQYSATLAELTSKVYELAK
jgi:hypothetical protein